MRSPLWGILSSVILISLITLAVLNWLHVPIGNFSDWVVALGTFVWLTIIVTVPWNIYFEAREVINEAEESERKKIEFDKTQIPYVQRLASRSLSIAILLHIASTAGLYLLAYYQISVVGYYGAGAALLLTILRPAIRLYEYISKRLSSIREQVKYPREDIDAMKIELENLKYQVDVLNGRFDTEIEDSWINEYQSWKSKTNIQVKEIQSLIENLQTRNQKEHEELKQETKHAVSQLNEEGKFMEHISEIIRFIKKV